MQAAYSYLRADCVKVNLKERRFYWSYKFNLTTTSGGSEWDLRIHTQRKEEEEEFKEYIGTRAREQRGEDIPIAEQVTEKHWR